MFAKLNKIIHESFLVGIVLKGINAVLEIAAAIGLFFVTPGKFFQAVSALTARELLEDPQDKLANYFLHAASAFSVDARLFIFVYLLSHGLIKICLVIALLKRYLWAYPLAMAVFGGFVVYQLYRFTHTHSAWLIVLTVFDMLVIILTWLEYDNLRRSAIQEE
jgi:uncharacterized membrane protein